MDCSRRLLPLLMLLCLSACHQVPKRPPPISGPAAPPPATPPTRLVQHLLSGNGEGYGGPHLRGESIPFIIDQGLDTLSAATVVSRCLNYAVLRTFSLKARLNNVLMLGDSEVLNTSQADPGMLYYTSERYLALETNPAAEFFTVRVGYPAAQNVKVTLLRPPLTINLESQKTKLTGQWVLPDGLPILTYRMHVKDEHAGRSFMSWNFVEKFEIKLPKTHGIAVPLLNAGDRKPVGLTFNTVEYAHCLADELGIEITGEWRPGDEFVLPSATSWAQLDGEELAEWKKVPGRDVSMTDAQVIELEKRAWYALEVGAQRLYQRYMDGRVTPEFISELHAWGTQNGPANTVLKYHIHDVFQQKTLERFSRSRSPDLKRFAEKARDEGFFRLIVGKSPKGGFHRGERYIYFNLLETPPEEWPIIFIHENAHAMCDQLLRGEGINNTILWTYPLIQWSGAKPDPDGLPADVRDVLDWWLLAGLDRGLLSEWRAWTVTFHLYQEGLRDDLWPKLPWMEELLAQRHPGEDLKAFTFRLLDPEFTDPTEGNYALPLVSRELKVLRGKLTRGEIRPVFGSLGEFVKGS